MSFTDTIAAIATPGGTGGVGIVRISGDDLRPFASLLRIGKLPPPRLATRTQFVDITTGKLVDDGLALYFPKPQSFTGESVLELHAHGGNFVLQALLAACLRVGARQAAAGEFTLRAYLNGKIDLTQSEALADLINAGSAAAATAAAQSLRGDFKNAVDALTAKTARVRAELEGSFDFSDDDALLPDSESAVGMVASLCDATAEVLRQAKNGAMLTRGANIVIGGAPNVGKSSLINRLAGDDVAIVSSQAGTTRDTVERHITVNGVLSCVTDTAGLRDTDDAVEQEGVRRARQKLAAADVLVLVETEADVRIGFVATAAATATVRVVNKIDLSGMAAGEQDGIVYVSAKTGAGMEALRKALAAALGAGVGEAPFSARQRHVSVLEKALTLLQEAHQSAAMPEVAAAWLRDAQAALAAISGDNTDDERLLADIFSRFCVGK